MIAPVLTKKLHKDFVDCSPNPDINATIKALLALGCPPIPVAPKQNPRNEWCHRVVKNKEGHLFCPVDKSLNPIPKFTGKNPSYIDRNGSPRICKHGEFQNRLPTEAELRRFFCHPDTGVGTLGGHAGVVWLDFDTKCYASQEACDQDVVNIIERGNLQNTWIERTGSGGWRIAVKPRQKPSFTNFATNPNGQHLGEALFEGRFTVLSPTIHPNGKPYRRVGWGGPVEVESLEAIGIFPSKDELEQAERNQKREQRKASNPHFGQPTNPQDNPWDIRNFAHYFEGYHEQGNGWAAAKCPSHNGTSQTSFRVKLDTGEYKLWCGCNTKDVYKSGLALALASGYKLPEARPEQEIEVTPANEQGIRFKVLRKSLDQLLEIFPELQTEAGKDWLKMRKFTPDHTINSQYFDWESDKPGTHLAVKSGLGTGKTHHVHHRFLADDNIGANAFGYRNSLLLQFVERGKNWYHLQQDLKQSEDNMLLIADPSSRISACCDSLIYVQGQHFKGKRLILDEIEGSFKHLYQSKTAVSFHRQVCKERMGQAIANSEAVIMLDGNLTDLTVAHAERISGKKFTKVENLFKGNRGKVDLYTGTLKLGKDEETGETIVTERRINDYSLLHKMMMGDTEPFICGSDSQEKLEAWHEILRLKGRKVFRLDGSNSNTAEAKKFLADPAKYILDNGIEIVLYSPTAESGLSIDLQGYFKNAYYFFFGIVQTNEQMQFLGRPRDPGIHIRVFCQDQGIDGGKLEQTTTHVQEAYTDYTLACSRISLSDVSEGEKQKLIAQEAVKLVERSNDPHFQYECHLKAREIFEKNHLRKCFEYALYTAGHQVRAVVGCKVSKEELEAAQEAVQIRKSENMFAAQPLTDDQAKDVARKFDASPQEKLEVARHKLVSRLPGIESKTFTTSRVVTLPQSSVDEIKSGRVSLETVQKLGIPMPETPSTQELEVGHLPPNSLNNQGEGGSVQGELLNQRSDGSIGVVAEVDLGQNETAQIPNVSTSEAPTTQAIDLGHLPLDFSINQGEGGSVSEGGEVEVVITETKPIFSPEFIRKVKFQDRAWLSKVELHFLVQHPEIAKLLQQRRWYKKLLVFSDPNEPDCVKRLNLSTYKSDWLKVHTLLEMGIGHFLNPESRWTQDSPEAVAFWEKGKDAQRARYVGTSVGESNPCEYIGRILKQLDIKTKSQRVKNESGEKIRIYRVDTDYLSSPMRSAVYECVQQRIESRVQSDPEALNWDAIVENTWANETDQNPGVSTSETPTTQLIEVGHLPLNFSINQGGGGSVSEGGDSRTDLERLIDALEAVGSLEEFSEVVGGRQIAIVEDAIAFALSQPKRKQLEQWLEQLSQSDECGGAEVAQSDNPPLSSYKPGDEVWGYFPQSEQKWLKATVEWVRGGMVRVISGFFGMHIERPELIAPGDWVLDPS
jgi:hypothetical protein